MSKELNHVAIILDGNGRWAEKNGHTRNYGHKKGCDNLVKIAKYARKKNIKYLSLFAFSTENWSRPEKEVKYLMSLIKIYLSRYADQLVSNNICVKVIGTRKNLSQEIINIIDKIENMTKNCNGNYLNICFNYGSHEEIVNATKNICIDFANGKISLDDITDKKFEDYLYTKGVPAVDLLIRTSGEQRVSNFLLWQIAYSEFMFVDVCWPAFSCEDFDKAVEEYNKRTRRFGGLV